MRQRNFIQEGHLHNETFAEWRERLREYVRLLEEQLARTDDEIAHEEEKHEVMREVRKYERTRYRWPTLEEVLKYNSSLARGMSEASRARWGMFLAAGAVEHEKRRAERLQRNSRESARHEWPDQHSDADIQELLDAGYKSLATQHHPDKGGTHEKMVRINKARRVARDRLKANR